MKFFIYCLVFREQSGELIHMVRFSINEGKHKVMSPTEAHDVLRVFAQDIKYEPNRGPTFNIKKLCDALVRNGHDVTFIIKDLENDIYERMV